MTRPLEPRPPRPVAVTPGLKVITCEGCDESWAWSVGDMSGTFSEWYQFLDDLLLEHVVKWPLCWQNLARR